jgi:hypothetical protein
VTVLPCKSHDASGNGSIASIIECYQYMVTEKAAGYDIIATNNSYGGCPEACGFDRRPWTASPRLESAGILFAVRGGEQLEQQRHDAGLPRELLPAQRDRRWRRRRARTGWPGSPTTASAGVMVGAPGSAIESTISGATHRSADLDGDAAHRRLAALIHAYDRGLNIYQIRNLICRRRRHRVARRKTVSGQADRCAGVAYVLELEVFAMLRPLDSAKAGKRRSRR